MFRGLKSLLAGLIAGVAAGVIFAPKKGEELRKDFKNEVKKGGTGLSTLKGTLTDMGKDIGDTYEDIASNKKVQEAKEVIMEKGKPLVKKAKKAIKKFTK